MAKRAGWRAALFCAAVSLAPPGWAERPREFVPDASLSAIDLGRLATAVSAWRIDGGDIVIAPGADAHVVMLWDKNLQDLAISSRVKCSGSCDVGLLLRGHPTADGGIRGYLVSPGAKDRFSALVLDKAGKVVSRVSLPIAPGYVRSAPLKAGAPTQNQTLVPAMGSIGGAEAQQAAVIPVGGTPATAIAMGNKPALQTPPPRPAAAAMLVAEWNELNVVIDANLVRASLNGERATAGVTDDDAQSFGTISLFVGPGHGEVRFTDIAYKDQNARHVEPERLSPSFTMQRLDEFYYGWDVAVADIDRDGTDDIVSGPYYYLGPNFTERREIYLGTTYNPGSEFAPNMITQAADVDGDGWPDVLATEMRQIVLYSNPRGAPHRWQRHVIAPGVASEIALLRDLNQDGRPELIFVQEGRVVFAQADPADPTKPWPVFYVSAPGGGSLHGLGVGDVDGDGLLDILQASGWWKQPAGGSTAAAWTFHATAFTGPDASQASGGGEMAVFDANGDGLADVVTSLNAHRFGLAWFEQKRARSGEISFVRHMIMDDFRSTNAGGLTFSQPHAGVVSADIDGDGIMDFVTGKKAWAHLDTYMDPDPNGAAYLVWYRGIRDRRAAGGVRFVPDVIHNRSGVGSAFEVVDLNKDCAPDIVTSTIRGTAVFWGKPGTRKATHR